MQINNIDHYRRGASEESWRFAGCSFSFSSGCETTLIAASMRFARMRGQAALARAEHASIRGRCVASLTSKETEQRKRRSRARPCSRAKKGKWNLGGNEPLAADGTDGTISPAVARVERSCSID